MQIRAGKLEVAAQEGGAEFGLVYDPCAPEKVVIDGKEQVLGGTIYPGLELVGSDNWVDNRGQVASTMPAHILIEAENYQALSAATVVAVQVGKTSEPPLVLSKVAQTRGAKHRQCSPSSAETRSTARAARRTYAGR